MLIFSVCRAIPGELNELESAPAAPAPVAATAAGGGRVTQAQITALKEEMFALNSAKKMREAGAVRKKVKELEALFASQGPEPPGYQAPSAAAAPVPQRAMAPAPAAQVAALRPAAADGNDLVATVTASMADASSLLVDPPEPTDEDDPSLLGTGRWARGWE